MDLVVGATGLVGQQVALGLRRHGRGVRALVRGGKHHEKAAPLLAAGIEIVDADLTKPESLPSACAGAETVLSTGDAKVSYISVPDVVAFALVVAGKPSHPSAILEMGGPEPLSQLDAIGIFERTLARKVELDQVPVATLEEQHRSSDPLQKTFAALMIGYAQGDLIPGAAETARRYGVTLHSVSDYAAIFRKAAAAH